MISKTLVNWAKFFLSHSNVTHPNAFTIFGIMDKKKESRIYGFKLIHIYLNCTTFTQNYSVDVKNFGLRI
jgi:hypothetical protein